MENASLRARTHAQPHKLDAREDFVSKPPAPVLRPDLAALQRYPHLCRQHSCILSYVYISLDDFLALAQVPTHKRCNTSRTLCYATYAIFRPLDDEDGDHKKEVLSLRKLDSYDCIWPTFKVLLGWIFDSVNLTISLPLHRSKRLN